MDLNTIDELSTSPRSRARQAKNFYQCGDCQRKFSRADHLVRHIKTHTLEKDHICDICKKRFTRPDLLKRHSYRHLSSSERLKLNRKEKCRPRVTEACLPCAASKVKCSEDKPCQRCRHKELVCRYSETRLSENNTDNDDMGLEDQRMEKIDPQVAFPLILRGQTEMRTFNLQSPASHCYPTTTTSTNQFDILPEEYSLQDPNNHMISNAGHLQMALQANEDNHPVTNSSITSSNLDVSLLDPDVEPLSFPSAPNILPSSVDRNPDSSFPQQNITFAHETGNGYAAFLKDLISYSQHEQPIAGSASYHLPLDQGDVWEMFMSSSYDWGFQSIISQGSAQLDQAAGNRTENASNSVYPEHITLLKSVEAFKASFWNWFPSPEDTGPAEQSHLSLPPTAAGQMQPHVSPNLDMFERSFTSTSRDKVLALLTSFCERQNIQQIIASFPSSTLIESLIPLALRYFASRPLGFIHVPTLALNSAPGELLAMLIAWGASLTSIPAIQRLGYAIPELVRKFVVKQWEYNNSMTRNMDCLRAFALTNTLFIWSGNKRKMEIAEGFTQHVLTILRRSSMLRKDHYKDIRPRVDEEGSQLDQTWRSWVEQETKKRLIHYLFVYDCQVSMNFFTNPLVSCAEMLVPLPEPDQLWLAETSEKWKSLIIRREKDSQRLPQSLCHLTQVTLCQNRKGPDSKCYNTLELSLYVIWHSVWNVKKYQDIHHVDGWVDHADDPFLRNDYHRVVGFLNNLSTLDTNDRNEYTELSFFRAFLSMVLHTPSQAIQSFVGKHGEAEAARVYPILQEWVASRDARLGIWHAGRAIRTAELLPPALLRDFYAVIVYQASLTLYSYGVVVATRRRKLCYDNYYTASQTELAISDYVWLGEENLAAARRFVNLGEGVPVIGNKTDEIAKTKPCSIFRPGLVLEYTTQVLKRQRQVSGGVLPPFVDSLTKLLGEIGRAASMAGLG